MSRAHRGDARNSGRTGPAGSPPIGPAPPGRTPRPSTGILARTRQRRPGEGPRPVRRRKAPIRSRSAISPRQPRAARARRRKGGPSSVTVDRAGRPGDTRGRRPTAAGPGVLDHVGERLLHHPVRGQVERRAAGRAPRSRSARRSARRPGPARPGTGTRAAPGCGTSMSSSPAARRAEQAEQVPQLDSLRSARSPPRPAGPPGHRRVSCRARCAPRPPALPSRSRCGSRRRAVRQRSGPAPPRPPAGSAPRARPAPSAAVRARDPRPASRHPRITRAPPPVAGTRTSKAVNRAGTCGVVSGNAAVAMTAAVPTASSAAQRNRL